jgi:hypothetical protein
MKFTVAFSLNLCESCLLAITPTIDRLYGNGDEVWSHSLWAPKSFYLDLKALSFSDSRDFDLKTRSREARYVSLVHAKNRRDYNRRNIIRIRAADYNVPDGTVVSWGFDVDKFDEYLGEVNEENVPHGNGVKFYSDGSVYVGGWKEGIQHSETRGQWTSSLGLQYDGKK